MSSPYCELPGDTVEPSDLAVPKARDLALRLAGGRIEFARLVDCKRNGSNETVVFDVDVEVPQIECHPIEPIERIAATFQLADELTPSVLALRLSFPRVPHLNLHEQELPRSLCLFSETYKELKRSWTSPQFVRRIRMWLALTAKGELHRDDQPLEPLLGDCIGQIVLPASVCNQAGSPSPMYLTSARRTWRDKRFFTVISNGSSERKHGLAASVHLCPPQMHGIIHRRPVVFRDLVALVRGVGVDLLQELRAHLRQWLVDRAEVLECHLLIMLIVPRTRVEGGTVETHEAWAFIVGDPGAEGELRQVGAALGVWETTNGHTGVLLSPGDSERGQDLPLDVVNVAFELSRSLAALQNGEPGRADEKCVAVGAGALGSHVALNLARCGFGRWTFVDHDHLMPHNVARHGLDGRFVGWNKAEALAAVCNSLCPSERVFSHIAANVLDPGTEQDSLNKAVGEAQVILDMSTSIAVARKLACDIHSAARRASAFLSPSGRDLVMLGEDSNRAQRLDAIEMQYYRAVAGSSEIHDHLAAPTGRQRYAQSCRDIATSLPQDLVALHAATAARGLKRFLRAAPAFAAVWTTDEHCAVRRVDIELSPVVNGEASGWRVTTDEFVLRKMHALRSEKLPNETGGVLLGAIDLERRAVYIADVLPSPQDSREWPTLYIRGHKGLASTVEQVRARTAGMIDYLGEWHSHPVGAALSASTDDATVFSWITAMMECDGLPPTMIIVGDRGEARCFVEDLAGQAALLALHEQSTIDAESAVQPAS